jgi:hypothetical protein
MGFFQPMFIFPNELSKYGLPSSDTPCSDGSSVQDLVCTASTLIDEYCGRTDGDGNGSLVYTTYQERLVAQSPGRNIYLIPHRPIVPITQAQILSLSALDIASGGYYYTGCLPSINNLADGTLSAIIAASGRYVPGRRDMYGFQDDPGSYVNPLNTITLFGGPPPWNAIDMQNLDYNTQTGETWLSSGLYLARYSEVIITYNSGFDPRFMPQQIKRATAAAVKNLMAKGDGTTGMTSFRAGRSGVSAEFDPLIIDQNIQQMLMAFVTVRAT